MPVSHLGLTVSHIKSATSFYLSALQPLGYRYIGSRGDAVGLGVHEADFFLTQDPSGLRPTPTHIAFAAHDRTTVRNCYAASIHAGGHASGPPSYREDDCNCYNAAVEDLDGNTVEFIWREASYSRPSSKEMSMDPRAGGLKRASTDPVKSSATSLFGAVFGAAAGAALGYAVLKSGQDDRSRRESPRDSRYRQDERPRRSTSVNTRSYNDRYAPRAVEQRSHDDGHVSYIKTRYTVQSNGQSRAVEAIEYNPSRFSMKRSTTMPVETESRYERRASLPEPRSRRDSVVSHSRSRAHSRTSGSQASTIKPAKTSTYYSAVPGSRFTAAEIPLPPSEVRSRYTAAEVPLPQSEVRSRYTAAEVPLPPSEARSASRKSRKKFDAYFLPSDDDDDGLGDTATIVPDDSISCVGLPRRRRSRSRHGSTMTLPTRSRREEPRMRAAYSNA